jgi:hypothetical protein
MEKLYKKKKNGRYEEYSLHYGNDLSDGVWLVQTKPYSKSLTSLFWKVGDLKRITDVTTHSALAGFETELTEYLMKLTDANSEEYKDAKENRRGYIMGPIGYSNISAYDLCGLFLRKIAMKIEEENLIKKV